MQLEEKDVRIIDTVKGPGSEYYTLSFVVSEDIYQITDSNGTVTTLRGFSHADIVSTFYKIARESVISDGID